MKKLIFLSLLLIAGINYLGATNFTVSNNADTGTGSLRAAIVAANADENFPHSITTNAAYTITLASALPQITKAMTINAIGTNLLTINCPAGIATSTMNIAASTGNVVLNYLVLQNASVLPTAATVNGGALTIGGSNTVTINNCQFLNNLMSTNNTAYDVNGGAINISTGATVTINNSNFEGNIVKSTTSATTKSANGGAILNNGSLTINNSTFKSNSAKRESPATAGNTSGGAIRTYGNLNSNNCVFDGNYAQSNGPAIFTSSLCTIDITNSVVKNSTGNGAAVSAVLSGTATTIAGMATLNISNSLITNNVNSSNSTYGGGVFAAANTSVNNTEISGNSACRGGGITLGTGLTNTSTSTTYKTKLTMIGCTVSGNSLNGLNASALGGGMYVQGATSDLTDNCIFANCTVSGNSTPTVGGTVTTSAGGGVNIGGGGSGSWVTTCTFNNCTLTGNSSQGNITTSKGGGIDRDKGNVILNYCIVAGNNSNSTVVAANANKDLNVAAANLGSSTGCNLFGGTASFSLTGSTETTGNVPNVSDISTTLNTTLTDNGGTTALPVGGYVKTHALVGVGSAINPTAASVGLQTTDQRGFTRDATPDMGAYEVSTSSNLSKLGTLDNTTITVPQGVEFVVDANKTVKAMVVQPGAKITFSSGTLTATNGITLESSETATATLKDSYTEPTINATVKQYVTAGRNWYLSAPVSAADFSWLNRGTSVQGWSEATKSWVLVTNGTLVKGKGYVQVATTVVSPPSVTGSTGTVNVTGTTNSGDVAITVSRTEDGLSRGFNLIGNPYPSYLKWSGINSFLAETTNDSISTSFWYRTKNASDAYVFTTWNGTANEVVGGSTVNSVLNEYIPPMQAFWIRVNANTAVTTHNVNLTFKNNMRFHGVADNNKFKAPKNEQRQLLRLQLKNGSNSDEALIYFDTDAANSFDNYDSPKMMNNSAVTPDLYTKVDAERLVINGLNAVSDNMELPLGFSMNAAASLKLKATQLSNFPEGMKVYLLDKDESTQTELQPETEYSFSTSTATTNNESRFSLLFRVPSVSTSNVNTENEKATVFVNANNKITIIAPEKANYSIFNAVGQLIENGQTTAKLQTVNCELQTGLYIVKVGNNSTRVIVK